jgi:hypothetical protein
MLLFPNLIRNGHCFIENAEFTTALPPVESYADSVLAHKPPCSAMKLSCHDPGAVSVQAITMSDSAKAKTHLMK